MRIVKEHDERRNEILDAAAKLFSVKGYGKCTVNDILETVGIAKGTFYYYFKSKEEVLDAIIERVTENMIERTAVIADNKELSPEEKLLQVFLSLRVEDAQGGGLLDELHKPENALMHQKSLESMVKGVVPSVVKVVEEGNEKGVFHAEYPLQYMQIFLTSVSILLDEGMFAEKPQEQQYMFRALIALLGKMLDIPDEPMWDKVLKYWM